MSSINSTLSLARRALIAQQTALQVAGENIANVNTDGYARKRAELSDALTYKDSFGIVLGAGVDVSAIRSLRDQFIEQQMHRTLADMGRYDAAGQQLSALEGTLGELGATGLSGKLDGFWSAWHDLARDPSSSAPRAALREAGRGLAETFRNISLNLKQQTERINYTIIDKVNRVNNLASQLATANANPNPSLPGEIDDARMRLIDELASLAGATYRLEQNGNVTLFIGNAIIVDNDMSRAVTLETDDAGNFSLASLTVSGVRLNVTNGEIAGLFTVRDIDIVEAQDRLDELALTLVKSVNELHASGYGLDRTTGVMFFDSGTTGATDIKLSNDILADYRKIAASASGDPGDNSIALSISELETGLIFANGRQTLADGVQDLIARIGARVSENNSLAESAGLAKQQAESWRDSVSGVSLDEEMTNLIRYENAFQAAAKMVTTVDRMMDAVISMV